MKEIEVKKIQKISTPDGNMVPIFRDWDFDTNLGHKPKMVYATSLDPGIEKDIILHERRTAYITCIQSAARVDALLTGKIHEIELDFENSNDQINLLLIPSNVPIKIYNVSKNTSILINCPNPSWHPDDPDTIKFKDWSEYKKWQSED